MDGVVMMGVVVLLMFVALYTWDRLNPPKAARKIHGRA